MDLTATLIILAVSAAVAGVSNWRLRRPYEPGQVRWIPYTALQYAALVVLVLMLAHLVSLLTGTPLVGRLSR